MMKVVSNIITASITADVYRIEAADSYPTDYEATVERNKREQEQDTYAVSGMGDAIDDYTRACPDSTIGGGRVIRGEEAGNARSDVEAGYRGSGCWPPDGI